MQQKQSQKQLKRRSNMKYIDADILRKEIEKRLKNTRDYMTGAGMKYKGPKYYKAQGKESAYDALLNILDSLQKEQQEVDLDSEIEEYWIATEWSKVITLGKFKVIARYFYGLGQLNSK